ncbi:MAG: glycosyltransferase, partial [Clostridiales bacterium]|nr:glycosyltransferase [Clostridiales bacterium]
AQDYPRALFDLYVVPNNCTDDTAGAARRAGASILTCTFPVKCKGDVLRQAFSQLLASPVHYDAFCVFDADNVVDPRFLDQMNRALCTGVKVAKGRDEAMNPESSWVSGCYAIYFGLFNRFFNQARDSCGLSAGVRGTGFVVHRSVLERGGGWHTVTITEDIEFSSQCALWGERVAWVDQAVTWDEQPNSFRASLTQRRRWCSGSMQVAGLHMPALARRILGDNGRLSFDFICYLLVPYIQALSPLPVGLLLFWGLLRSKAVFLRVLWLIGAGGAVSALLTMAAAVLVVCLTGNRPHRMWRAIVTFPLFMLSWLPLQILSLFQKTTVWKEVRHTGGELPEKAA